MISLESFLKMLSVVDGIEEVLSALKPEEHHFESIDEVLKSEEKTLEKGRLKNENSNH